MKRKILTLGLSLCVLTALGVPDTLAAKAAAQSSLECEQPVHIDGCSDACESEDCVCECHKLSLFEQLMACETYEELMEMIEGMTEEEVMMLTLEQAAQVEEKALELEPQPLPEVIFDEPNDEPIVSEMIYPTVNFDHVAPFGEPVAG